MPRKNLTKYCPLCGQEMKLILVQKGRPNGARRKVERYECECGHEEAKEWESDARINDELEERIKKKQHDEPYEEPDYSE